MNVEPLRVQTLLGVHVPMWIRTASYPSALIDTPDTFRAHMAESVCPRLLVILQTLFSPRSTEKDDQAMSRIDACDLEVSAQSWFAYPASDEHYPMNWNTANGNI